MSDDDDDDEVSGSLSKRSRGHDDPDAGLAVKEDDTQEDRESVPPSSPTTEETKDVKDVRKGVKEVELEDKKTETDSAVETADGFSQAPADESEEVEDMASVKEPLATIPEASESTNVVLVLDEGNGESITPSSSDEKAAESVADEPASAPVNGVEEVPAKTESEDEPAKSPVEEASAPTFVPVVKSFDNVVEILPSIPASMPLPPSPKAEEVVV